MYTLFIDESGEAGVKKVRSTSTGGASPYMTLGAVVIENCSKTDILNELETIKAEINKNTLHCSKLSHYQLLHYIRRIPKKEMTFFGVISNKATLGNYKDEIDGNSSKYYNKCVQYLLERVGWFMETRKIPTENLNIVFEKANTNYGRMKNFLRTCQKNPMHHSTQRLCNIDVDRIEVKQKEDEPLLQIADLVAHALYKCVDKQRANHGIPEPRYLKELAYGFFGNPNDKLINNAGIFCVHNTKDLKLDRDVESIIVNLKAQAL